MNRLNYPIEGDFIASTEGCIHEVKDMHHPYNHVIGFMRYYPLSTDSQPVTSDRQISIFNQTCQFNKGTILPKYYRKLAVHHERFRFVQANFPEYLFHSPSYEIPLMAIPYERIWKHYCPETWYQDLVQMQKMGQNLPPLLQDAVDFCQALNHAAQIDTNFIGITGSLLTGLFTPESDFDLIIYGYQNSMAVRRILADIFQGTTILPEIRPYSLSEFQNLYHIRAHGSPLSFSQFLGYEVRKLHQGFFRNRAFFIRFLECASREEYAATNQFDHRQIYVLGRIQLSGIVMNDEFWWTCPSRVKITQVKIESFTPSSDRILHQLDTYHLKLEQISQIFSLRGRFIENVRLLEHFRTSGTVELVISKTDPPRLQVSLGNSPEDFCYLV